MHGKKAAAAEPPAMHVVVKRKSELALDDSHEPTGGDLSIVIDPREQAELERRHYLREQSKSPNITR